MASDFSDPERVLDREEAAGRNVWFSGDDGRKEGESCNANPGYACAKGLYCEIKDAFYGPSGNAPSDVYAVIVHFASGALRTATARLVAQSAFRAPA